MCSRKHTEHCWELKKKEKTYPLWIGSVTVVITSILLKCIHRFHTIAIQTPDSFVDKIDKLIFKSVWKCKGSKIIMTFWKYIIYLYFLISRQHKTIGISTVWFWCTEQSTQINKTEKRIQKLSNWCSSNIQSRFQVNSKRKQKSF